MWGFWIVIFVFWVLVYFYKRCQGKLASSNAVASEKAHKVKPSILENISTNKLNHPAARTAAADSDAEERSSISSSDDESVHSMLSDGADQRQEIVRLGLGQLVVESSRFNSFFHRIANGQDNLSLRRQKRWQTFFGVGQLISVILIIPCFILLVLMLFSMSQDVIRQISGNWFELDSINESVRPPYKYSSYETDALLPAVAPPRTTTVSVIATTTALFDNSRYKTDAVAVDVGSNYEQADTSSESRRNPHPFVAYSPKPARYTTSVGFDSGWIPRMKFLLPGFNIDASQVVMLLLAVLVCTVVHESGHAVSAVAEGLPLDSVGFAFVICFPIAFAKVDVDGDADNIAVKNSKVRENDRRGLTSATVRKLRVLCAGVWCNVVFCVACLAASLFISFALLLLSSLLSTVGGGGGGSVTNSGRTWALQRDGVLVTNVSADSAQYSHLLPGDRITALNGCAIRSVEDLHRCLTLEAFGYCLRDDEVRHIKVKANPLKTLSNVLTAGDQQQQSTHKCCGTSPAALAAGLCFSRAEVYNQSFAEVQCLNIRRLLQFKLDNSLCFNASNDCAPGSNKHCYMPILDRSERLFIIDKYPGIPSDNYSSDNEHYHGVTQLTAVDIAEKEKIVIIGSARDVLSTKFMQSFRNTSLLPSSNATITSSPFIIGLAHWIYAAVINMQVLLNTCAGVSIAIALLNIVPCVHLDGDKIVQVIVSETLHLGDNYEGFASFLTSTIIYAGTTLVMLTVAVAFGSALLDAW